MGKTLIKSIEKYAVHGKTSLKLNHISLQHLYQVLSHITKIQR